jgi:hypothetical protein
LRFSGDGLFFVTGREELSESLFVKGAFFFNPKFVGVLAKKISIIIGLFGSTTDPAQPMALT